MANQFHVIPKDGQFYVANAADGMAVCFSDEDSARGAALILNKNPKVKFGGDPDGKTFWEVLIKLPFVR